MLQFKNSSLVSAVALIGSMLVVPAHAQSDILVLLKAGDVTVTSQDVLAELARVPPDKRQEMVAKPETIGVIAQNLYLRRALSKEAEDKGYAADPMVKTLLKLNQERFLTDVMLEKMDEKSKPSQEATEKMALAEYKSKPKDFESQEEVHARHILIRFGDDKAAARTKIEAILAELKNGADFEALAKEKSEDPGSAAKGGDLGTFGHGRMVKEFEDAAFAMNKPGELSPIIESKFGYHILKLDEKIPVHVRPFEEVKGPLIAEVRQKAVMDARKLEAERLTNLATIQGDNLQKFVAAQKAANPAPADAAAPAAPEAAK